MFVKLVLTYIEVYEDLYCTFVCVFVYYIIVVSLHWANFPTGCSKPKQCGIAKTAQRSLGLDFEKTETQIKISQESTLFICENRIPTSCLARYIAVVVAVIEQLK